jgi:hypothetical protein
MLILIDSPHLLLQLLVAAMWPSYIIISFKLLTWRTLYTIEANTISGILITAIKTAYVRLWFADIHISVQFSRPVFLCSRSKEIKWGKCKKSEVFKATNYNAV